MASASAPPKQRLSPEVAGRIEHGATIPESALLRAHEHWSNTAKSIAKGCADDNLEADYWPTRSRYVSIARLADEARRLTLQDSASRDIRTLYAIDPHLIMGYCRYWDDSYFKSFDFLGSEWTAEERQDETRTKFIVFILASILRMSHLICLDAGRQEISTILAFFLRQPDPAPVPPGKAEEVDEALQEIENIIEFNPSLRWSREQVSQYIAKKFEALIQAGAIPEMQRGISRARLVHLLKQGTLFASFAAVRNKLGDEHAGRIATAQSLYKAFRADAERMRRAEARLDEAYVSYLRTNRIVADIDGSTGRRFNLGALLEISLINSCLAEANVPASISYVTASSRMFAFISEINSEQFRVNLVHPRHVFIFEDKTVETHRAHFEKVLSGANAFVRAVPQGGGIRPSELDDYEGQFADVLRSVRSTYSFAPMNIDTDRTELARVIDHYRRKYATSEAQKSQFGIISEFLKRASENVEEAFEISSDIVTTEGFEAYSNFCESLGQGGSNNELLVRAFGETERDGSDESIGRLVCIAISGGFRNIFKIYYPAAVARIKSRANDDGVILMTAGDLLEEIKQAAQGEGEASGRPAAEAAFHVQFMRSIYSMGNREWLLSLSLGDIALDMLGSVDGAETDGESAIITEGGLEMRRRLMKHEILLLQHYARRGVAANLEPLLRRQFRMRQSANDLYESAKAAQSIDERKSFTIERSPNSIRLALSAIAIQIEWLALKVETVSAGAKENMGDRRTYLLPPARGDHNGWEGLSLTDHTLEALWSDPDAARKLISDTDIMVKRVASIVAAVDIREPIHDHNPAYWRYIQQRALQLRLLIQLLRELNIFETSSPAPFDAGLITQFESQLVAHDEYVERKRGAAASFARETHPFSSFLIDALRFTRGRKAASEAGEDEVVAMLERCRALIAISKYHQELGWSSFARSVSQAFLSTHGSNTFRELFGNWEELVRETSLRHAFESADAHEQRRRALFEQWSTEALEEEPQI